MTHGHEQWWGGLPEGVGVLSGGGQREKNWGNCNIIAKKKETVEI